jgi:serine acetyltransferase
MGTHRNFGAAFASAPNLPHGLNGIVVSHNAKIGKNCTIFHQVTIGEGRGGAPEIGDHVLIGAGAKIIGGMIAMENVKTFMQTEPLTAEKYVRRVKKVQKINDEHCVPVK